MWRGRLSGRGRISSFIYGRSILQREKSFRLKRSSANWAREMRSPNSCLQRKRKRWNYSRRVAQERKLRWVRVAGVDTSGSVAACRRGNNIRNLWCDIGLTKGA
ncbi:unnamed protein product [Amoebophrya sp. A120]|nr:unnamed protein product [Amoebophrya sp. A120]|eukprot:GSA120T00001598001.1